MITLRPQHQVDLEHRAFHVVGSPDGSRLVALAPSGRGTYVHDHHRSKVVLPFEAQQLSLDPSGDLLAVASAEGLLLMSPTSGQVQYQETGAYGGCLISRDGCHLWLTRPDGDRAIIELRRMSDLGIQATIEVQDPFGSSAFNLFPTPLADSVALWTAAGQDGQTITWLQARSESLQKKEFPALQDTSPPDFAPDGASFLVVSIGEILQYSFPQGTFIVSIPWPYDEDIDALGDNAVFLGPGHALVQSTEGRLYLADLTAGRFIEQVAIEGHEPRPIRELFPTLAHETGLGSDFSGLVRLSEDLILSIHQRLPSKSHEWNDQLLIWRPSGLRFEPNEASPS